SASFVTPVKSNSGTTLTSTALTALHGENNPAPLLSQKGVTAITRPPLANSAVHSFDSVLFGSHGNFSAVELRSPLVLPSQQHGLPSSSYSLCSSAVSPLRPELFLIVVAAYLWGPLWASKRVNFLSHNCSVVKILLSGTSRAPTIVSLVRPSCRLHSEPDSAAAPLGLKTLLSDKCHFYLTQGLGPSTRKVYAFAQHCFLDFCTQDSSPSPLGSALPASKDVLIHFCCHLADTLYYSSIKVYLSAIRTLTFHQYGPGSNPSFKAIYGLSLLLYVLLLELSRRAFTLIPRFHIRQGLF
ncbi:unnamed protein product, partial [Porites lobata]